MRTPKSLDFHEAFSRLPVLLELDGLPVRWVGPLIDRGLDRTLGDLSNAAYGHLEECGWLDAIRSQPFDPALGPAYATAVATAARRLASDGADQGPESDPEVWIAWLGFELSGLHGLLKDRAAARGSVRRP